MRVKLFYWLRVLIDTVDVTNPFSVQFKSYISYFIYILCRKTVKDQSWCNLFFQYFAWISIGLKMKVVWICLVVALALFLEGTDGRRSGGSGGRRTSSSSSGKTSQTLKISGTAFRWQEIFFFFISFVIFVLWR